MCLLAIKRHRPPAPVRHNPRALDGCARDLSFLTAFVYAGIGRFIATLITYPLMRAKVMAISEEGTKLGLFGCLRKMAGEGVGASSCRHANRLTACGWIADGAVGWRQRGCTAGCGRR